MSILCRGSWGARGAALGAVLSAGLVGCGGSRVHELGPDPGAERAVIAFLDAVRAKSLAGMAELWGTSRGPAMQSMPRDELQKRLTVMQIYLEHERYQILPSELVQTSSPNQTIRVRLTRAGCTPVVPFTVVRYRDRWLVESVDLTAVGNPAVPCAGGGPPRR